MRRKLARAAFDARAAWDRASAEAEQSKEDMGVEDMDAAQSAVSTTAFGVVVVALVVRFGGRAALLQILGLDVGADQAIADQIDGFLAWTRSFPTPGGFEDATLLLLYCGAFAAAKLLCLDALTFVLAVSSGVLFGGVVEGAVAATSCATVGSTLAFLVARYGRPGLREKLLVLVRRDPKTRALERAVVDRGFATVLVLRLAPLLPIPIGGYNYLYGATEMELAQFVPAMFLGSLKPYAFDSYLGVVGKSVVDEVASGGEKASGLSDPVLIGIFAAFLAVGAISSELAGQAWRDIEEASASDEHPEAFEVEGDWLDVLEVRESAPWRAWDGFRTAVADAEPEWSAELRADAKVARRTLRAMAREELALSRATDARVRVEEELPPREPAADELERRSAFLDRFSVADARDEDAIDRAPVPLVADVGFDLKQALLESIQLSFVVGRAVFDAGSLVEEEEVPVG